MKNKSKIHESIASIITRRSLGIYCTEQESAELKQFVIGADIVGRHLDKVLVEQIIELFPMEYGEAVEQMLPSMKKKFEAQVKILLDESEDDDAEVVEDTEGIIDRIAEHLRYADGEWVAKIANQVLDATVIYKGDDFYSVEEN